MSWHVLIPSATESTGLTPSRRVANLVRPDGTTYLWAISAHLTCRIGAFGSPIPRGHEIAVHRDICAKAGAVLTHVPPFIFTAAVPCRTVKLAFDLTVATSSGVKKTLLLWPNLLFRKPEQALGSEIPVHDSVVRVKRDDCIIGQ